jgi:hypothetical protein
MPAGKRLDKILGNDLTQHLFELRKSYISIRGHNSCKTRKKDKTNLASPLTFPPTSSSRAGWRSHLAKSLKSHQRAQGFISPQAGRFHGGSRSGWPERLGYSIRPLFGGRATNWE